MSSPEPDILDDIGDEDLNADDPVETEVGPPESPKEDENEEVTLASPHGVILVHPEGLFPTVTPEGTTMTRTQAKEAKAAAAAAHKKLKTVGGRR